MGKEKENVYFVGLEKPSELRRTLLESTRDVVDVMKKFEKFKSAREQKVREIEKLRADMREIYKLINKLRSGLPKTKLRVTSRKAPKKRIVIKKEEKQIKKKELTELDKLESELGAIEGKLKGLG